MRQLIILPLATAAMILAGCASSPTNDEFVKTVDFSSLQTFGYRHTLISGFDWREAEKITLETRSEEVLSEGFRERGFEEAGEGGDFQVVAKWRKAVSSSSNIFDSIDGPMAEMNDRNKPGYQFAPRLNLTVEIYESATGNLFWREELSNLFDANEFTDERVVASLERAIRNFPERVEKDPNLPDLQ